MDALGDRWSHYLTPEEAQQVKANRENTYVGIGITVGQNVEDGLEILRVTEGSPAQEAGLQAGGDYPWGWMVRPSHPTTGRPCSPPSRGGRGPPFPWKWEGTDGARRTVEVTRQEIHGVTATWTMTENQVGLVTILNFYAGTADLVKQGVARSRRRGPRPWYLTCGTTRGDTSQSSRRFWTTFSQRGNIFISRTSDGEEVTYTSDASCVDLPMAVMVNANSYSAAGVLCRSAPGICGRSGGRGADQRQGVFPDPLRFCPTAAIGLSTARYYTGKGCLSLAQGLRRTQRLPSVREDQQRLLAGELTPAEDAQFQAAVAALGLS